MIAVVLSLLLGFLSLAVVLYRLGSRWLDLQERDRRQEEGETDRPTSQRSAESSDEARIARLAREGPDVQAAADRAAWAEERRAEGYTDREIADMLADREPIFRI